MKLVLKDKDTGKYVEITSEYVPTFTALREHAADYASAEWKDCLLPVLLKNSNLRIVRVVKRPRKVVKGRTTGPGLAPTHRTCCVTIDEMLPCDTEVEVRIARKS